MYTVDIYTMTEPGTVSGTIGQSNSQGLHSINHYASFTVNSSGTDSIGGTIPDGGVGFSNSNAIGSKEGSGALGENDTVGGDTFGEQQVSMGEQMFKTDMLPESPYYTYNTKPLSNGSKQVDHKYHNTRSLGRGMNMDNIRSRVYYDESEVELFTWNLNTNVTNVAKDVILEENLETIRDV